MADPPRSGSSSSASARSSADQQTQKVLRDLLQGLNDMQIRQGLSPGGVPIPPTSQPLQAQTPPPAYRPLPPAEFSSQLMTSHLESQQMTRAVMPPPMMGSMTPVERGGGMPMPMLPPPMYGGGGMARQHAIAGMNRNMAGAQVGVGLANRGLGFLAATLRGGPLGAYNYEDSGQGQADQNAGMNLFNPLIANRAQALQLQRQSMNFVRGGQDLSASGTGLSMTASQRLTSGLNSMADSHGFQHATGGMFNRQDVSKIANLAGQMGMLDQAQTADQIRRQVGTISRGLSNFMRIAEQPDMQEAMRTMAQMRSMGMGAAESTQAVRNARSFARMAGIDTQTMMRQGMAGAGVFQQAGLSGAAGMQAGMASLGMAGQMASLMDPRRLALAGGAEGMAATLTGGAAQSAISPMFMASMLTRSGGHLSIDRQAMRRLMRGDMSIQQIAQQGAQRIQRLGGQDALMELSTRQGELNDQAQGMMGGQMSALMPLIQARAIQRGTPGMSLGGALRTMGMGENQARTYEQMAQSPQFWANMQRQQRQDLSEQRREVAQARQERSDVAGEGRFGRSVGRALDRESSVISGVTGRLERSLFGAGQDIAEAADGAPVLRADAGRDYGTTLGRQEVRRRLRTTSGAQEFNRQARERVAFLRADASREDATARSQDYQRGQGLLGIAGGVVSGNPLLAMQGVLGATIQHDISAVVGPDGLSAPSTRGQFLRETVMAQESLGTQLFHGSGLAALTGQTPTEAQITARADDLVRVGQVFETRSTQTHQQRQAATTATRDAVLAGMRRTRPGADAATASHTIDAATVAVNRMLEAHHTALGFGSDVAPVSSDQIQSTVRQSLIASGMSEAEATRLSSDPAYTAHIVGRGEDSRSPEASVAADHAISAAGDLTGVRTGMAAGELRELARTESRAVLEGMGVGTGLFSGTSDEAQTALLNVTAAGGSVGEAARLMLARDAAVAAGNTELATSLTSQIEGLGLSEEDDTRARDLLNETRGDLTDANLADMGASMEGLTGEQAAARLRAQHEAAVVAQQDLVQSHMVDAMGQEAYEASISERPEDALIRLAQNHGDLSGASEEERDAIAHGDRAAATAYATRMREQATAAVDGTNVQTSGGRSTRSDGTTMGNLSEIFGDIQEGAGTGLAPHTEDTGTEASGPREFIGAVGVFSRASAAMLQAAQMFHGGTSVDLLDAAASSGMDNAFSSILDVLSPVPSIIRRGTR